MVPIGWSLGASSSAVLWSFTMPRILLRTNSDAVSFDRLVHQQIGVGVEVADAAAFLPLGLVGGVALGFRHLERRLGRPGIAADGEGRVVGRAPARRILGLVLALALGLHRPVARRQAEIGGALEDGEVLGLLGDDRDHLHARRAGADHADPQPGEVDALMRPQAGVVPLALEVVDALEVGHARRREIARGHHAVARAHLLAAVGAAASTRSPRCRTAPT